MGKKLRTAEYSDQPIEPDQKARLLVAFADSGIRRQLVGVYPPAGEGPVIHFGISAQQQLALGVEDRNRHRRHREKVMANFLANGFQI